MTKPKAILLSIGLIIVNSIICYYLPPVSIVLSILIPAFIIFILSKADLQIYFKILIVIGAIILDDMVLKLSGGHPYDFEGAGLINLLSIIATVLATVISFVFLIKKAKRNVIYTSCFIILIPISVWLYLSYFDSMGLIDSENGSPSKEISIKNHLFLKAVQVSDASVAYKPDSIKILSGWAEKQVTINHEHLIKRYDDTSKVNYVLKLKSNRRFRDNNIYYQVNDASINGASPIDSVISFTCARTDPKVIVTFFKLTGDISKTMTIKSVVIK